MEERIKFAGLKFSSLTSLARIAKNAEVIMEDSQLATVQYCSNLQILQDSWNVLAWMDWNIVMIFEDDIGHWHHIYYLHGNKHIISSRICSEVSNLTEFATILQTEQRPQKCPWKWLWICQCHCSHLISQKITIGTDFVKLNLNLIWLHLHKSWSKGHSLHQSKTTTLGCILDHWTSLKFDDFQLGFANL